jgi:hypothetical protein
VIRLIEIGNEKKPVNHFLLFLMPLSCQKLKIALTRARDSRKINISIAIENWSSIIEMSRAIIEM